MISASKLTALATAVRTEFSEKNVTFLAGSIAYNAVVSLVPLLAILVLALAVAGAGWQDRFLALVTGNVSPTIGQFIERLFQQRADGVAGTSVVSILVLVWGASKLFRGLDTAFAMIYEVDGNASLGDQFRDGFVVLVSVVVATAAVVVATAAFDLVSGAVPYLGWFFPLVLTAGLVVAFYPMYYVFPNVDVSPREILPGVVVAAFGWALLQVVFQVYVTVSAGGGETSLVTGILLLITWLYFSGIVVLLGAVVNAVLGGHTAESRAVATA